MEDLHILTTVSTLLSQKHMKHGNGNSQPFQCHIPTSFQVCNDNKLHKLRYRSVQDLLDRVESLVNLHLDAVFLKCRWFEKCRFFDFLIFFVGWKNQKLLAFFVLRMATEKKKHIEILLEYYLISILQLGVGRNFLHQHFYILWGNATKTHQPHSPLRLFPDKRPMEPPATKTYIRKSNLSPPNRSGLPRKIRKINGAESWKQKNIFAQDIIMLTFVEISGTQNTSIEVLNHAQHQNQKTSGTNSLSTKKLYQLEGVFRYTKILPARF